MVAQVGPFNDLPEVAAGAVPIRETMRPWASLRFLRLMCRCKSGACSLPTLRNSTAALIPSPTQVYASGSLVQVPSGAKIEVVAAIYFSDADHMPSCVKRSAPCTVSFTVFLFAFLDLDGHSAFRS